MAVVHYADFVNILFPIDEAMPEGFTSFFKEEDLNTTHHSRVEEYQKIKDLCEDTIAEQSASEILFEYKKINSESFLHPL